MTTATLDAVPLCAALGRLFLEAPDSAADPEGAREYVRLFLHPQGAPCPPWQSVWEEDAGSRRLLGPAHHGALAFFREFGFMPNLESEPADHIGLLLLFYAMLLDRAAPPAQVAAFEKQHLGWIPRFAEALQRHAQTETMREAAAILHEVFPCA